MVAWGYGLLGGEGLFSSILRAVVGVTVVIRCFAEYQGEWGPGERNIDWGGNDGSVSDQLESNWFIITGPQLDLPALSSPGQDNGMIPLYWLLFYFGGTKANLM